ncbi:hypothetical protein E4U17_006936 [Claviceps sp. LM77 group G4]|nr:hypothetical protein E4U17_006936 [Claviceps sp. LM77 group G4]KAG6079486.1 hypothetical protein E4U16_001019 [Claviceps sp. LM84 group G4]
MQSSMLASAAALTGTFDIVGNNVPVFFIQDAIQFLHLIYSEIWSSHCSRLRVGLLLATDVDYAHFVPGPWLAMVSHGPIQDLFDAIQSGNYPEWDSRDITPYHSQ